VSVPRAWRLAAAASGPAVLLAPAAARACAVCGAGATDRNNVAFMISTIFLSLLPLIAVAAGALWLRRRARAVRTAESFAREAAATAGAQRA